MKCISYVKISSDSHCVEMNEKQMLDVCDGKFVCDQLTVEEVYKLNMSLAGT